METKNVIVYNFAVAVLNAANSIVGSAGSLSDNADENKATIKTLNVLVESLRSQTVLLQSELDKYEV